MKDEYHVRPSTGPHNRVHVRTCVLCVRLCPSRPTVYSSTESRSVSVCNVRKIQREKSRFHSPNTKVGTLITPRSGTLSFYSQSESHSLTLA